MSDRLIKHIDAAGMQAASMLLLYEESQPVGENPYEEHIKYVKYLRDGLVAISAVAEDVRDRV